MSRKLCSGRLPTHPPTNAHNRCVLAVPCRLVGRDGPHVGHPRNWSRMPCLCAAPKQRSSPPPPPTQSQHRTRPLRVREGRSPVVLQLPLALSGVLVLAEQLTRAPCMHQHLCNTAGEVHSTSTVLLMVLRAPKFGALATSLFHRCKLLVVWWCAAHNVVYTLTYIRGAHAV